MLSSFLPVVDTYVNKTRVSKTLFLQPTDQWEVAKNLKQVKNKKSYGLDESHELANKVLRAGFSTHIETHLAESI